MSRIENQPGRVPTLLAREVYLPQERPVQRLLDQAAQVLSISVSAVKMRALRARTRLRAILQAGDVCEEQS